MNRYAFKKPHIHTLDSKPLIGTSTAMKIIGGDKTGGLIWWASGMAVAMFGWLNPKPEKSTPEEVEQALAEGYGRVMKLSKEDYAKLLTESYKAHDVYKRERAKLGTARHELLEKYVKICLEKDGVPQPFDSGDSTVDVFVKWAIENIKKFLWAEAHCYSERLWLGGICDVGAEMKDGKICVGDFKSSKEAFVDQFLQDGAYGIQLKENGGYTPEGEKLFEPLKKVDGYFIVPFGAEKIVPQFVYDTQGCEEAAELAVNLYKKVQQFNKS